MTLGLRACAKELGVVHGRLLALVKEGRVPRNSDGSFDVEEVFEKFGRSMDPAQRSKIMEMQKAKRAGSVKGKRLSKNGKPVTPPADILQVQADEDEAGFRKIRTELHGVKLREAQLDLAEREKELVSVDEVRKVWGGHISAVKSRLLLLPSKLAPRVAVIGNVLEVQALIDTEIRAALTELSGRNAA